MYQTNHIYLTSDMKMSDVILNNPYLLLLLEHFGITAPFQEKNIATICTEKNINPELFLTFANLYNGVNYKANAAITYLDTTAILDYLKNSHNYYSNEIYPSILSTIEEMSEVNDQKEVGLVKKFFIDYFKEVSEHLDYENKVVFPYVLNLYEEIKNRALNEKTPYSVSEYKDHHNDIEEKLNDLKNLLIKYLPQKNDEQVRRKLLFFLTELEYDLSIHSKIEDFILIPLVAQMEAMLKDAEE